MNHQQPHRSNPKTPLLIFDITSLQWLTENAEPDHERAHYNKGYEIVWVTAGSVSHRIDLQRAESNDNRFFLIRPGQLHQYFLSVDAQGFRISFSEVFLELEEQSSDANYYNSLFRLLSGPEGIFISQDLGTNLSEILERMMKEFKSSHLFRAEMLKRYFKIFLMYLARHFEENFRQAPQTRNAELVQKFMCSLEQKYKTRKMVAEYAAELLVTPNYLNEIIKKTTGFSAGHHIRTRVVLEAKRLARYSDHCMKEIAYSLGFSDSAHFSKFFKSVTGKNFSEFKKEKMHFLPAA